MKMLLLGLLAACNPDGSDGPKEDDDSGATTTPDEA